MKKYIKKRIIILAVLILILAGGFLYWQIHGWPADLSNQDKEGIINPQSTESASPSAKEPREIVMEDAAQKIGQISPVKPVLGGHWFVDRFWFLDGSYGTFYVEYEDGHNLRRLLLTADTSQAPASINYQVDAYFEPGDSDWVLKTGRDQTSALPLILFEYDSDKKEWVQKN